MKLDERDDAEMHRQALHIAKGGWGEASVLARAYLLRVPNPATGKIEETSCERYGCGPYVYGRCALCGKA